MRTTIITLLFWAAAVLLPAAAQNIEQAWQIESEYAGGGKIGCDAMGNMYIVGGFWQTFQVGNAQLISAGSTDIFLAKYSPSGAVLWAKSIGGAGRDFVNDMKTDSQGNCYLAGGIDGQVQFDNIAITADTIDFYAAKFNTNGDLLWVRSFGGPQVDYASGLHITQQGDCFVAATYLTSVTIDNQTFFASSTGTSGAQAIALRLDPSGQVKWVRQSEGTDVWSGAHATNIAADEQGNVYLTGRQYGHPKFDSLTLDDHNIWGNLLFIVKFDTSGTARWAWNFNADPTRNLLDTDQEGNCYMAGNYEYGMTAYPFNADNADTFSLGISATNFFLIKFRPDGSVAFARDAKMDSTSYSDFTMVYGMDTDSRGNTYLAGIAAGQVTYGNHALSIDSPTVAPILACYDSSGNAIMAQRLTSTPADSYAYDVASGPHGVYVIGNFSHTSTFGNYTFTSSSSFGDIYLLRMSSVTSILEEEQAFSGVYLYPNPASDNLQLRFSLPETTPVSIKISNVTGQVVQEGNLGVRGAGEQNFNLPLNNLPSGMYVCIVKAGNSLQTHKLVVAR